MASSASQGEVARGAAPRRPSSRRRRRLLTSAVLLAGAVGAGAAVVAGDDRGEDAPPVAFAETWIRARHHVSRPAGVVQRRNLVA